MVLLVRVPYVKKKKAEPFWDHFVCLSVRLSRPFISRSRRGIKLKLMSNILDHGPLKRRKNQTSNAMQLKKYEYLCIVILYEIRRVIKTYNELPVDL